MQNTIEIQERILYYNNQIDYCDNDINDLYKQISQLEDLSDRLIQMKNKFEECQMTRRNSINKIKNLTINTNLTNEYSRGMLELISGNECINTLDGLIIARNRVEEKIFELQQEINRKKVQIYNYQNIISSLNRELYNLRNE